MTRGLALVTGALACAALGACRGRALVGVAAPIKDAAAADVAIAETADAPTDGGPDAGAVDAPQEGDGADGAVEDELLGLPLPVGTAPARRLLDGSAMPTGNGRSACSHAEPASGNGHRWCAFRLPGATASSTELWVMDVSAAAAGAPVVCDGSAPSCVRLTKTLWAPYSNDFEGDTLIFYSEAPAGLLSSEAFVGPISAWRPGWLAPRVIAPHATICGAAGGAATAVCLDDPRGKPGNPDDVVLRVGFLADLDDATLPALPGRFPLRSDGSIAWQLAFSPDGQTFVLSVADAGPFDPSLFVIPVRDVVKGASPVRIVEHTPQWTLSNDGKKVFVMRGDRGEATLTSVDFPAGGNEVTLATRVVDFLTLGRGLADKALLLRVKQDVGGHAFRLLGDHERPATAQTLFTSQGFEGIAVSPDLRFAAWLDPSFRARSIRVADLATCALNVSPLPPAGDLVFLEDSSSLFWTQPRQGGGGVRDGFLAPPDRCAPRTLFARGLGFLTPVGVRGLVFGDAHDESARTVTLKFAPAAEATTLAAGGVRVHANVTSPVTLVGGATSPTSVHVLFHAAADGAATPTPTEAGLYLFGPVPF